MALCLLEPDALRAPLPPQEQASLAAILLQDETLPIVLSFRPLLDAEALKEDTDAVAATTQSEKSHVGACVATEMSSGVGCCVIKARATHDRFFHVDCHGSSNVHIIFPDTESGVV